MSTPTINLNEEYKIKIEKGNKLQQKNLENFNKI